MTPAMKLLKLANDEFRIYEAGRKAGIRSGLDLAKDMAIIDGHFDLANRIKREIKQ